jgi:hypothetical protein
MKTLFAMALMLFSAASMAVIHHTPISGVKLGQRAEVFAFGNENQDITEARLYFKSNTARFFSFTPMQVNGKALTAQLPAPGPQLSSMDYYFVLQLADQSIVKSDVFQMPVSAVWHPSAGNYDRAVQAFSELKEGIEPMMGYIDNMKKVYQYAQLVDEYGQAVELASRANYVAKTAAQPAPRVQQAQTQSNSSSTAQRTAEAGAGFGGTLLGTVAVIGGAAYLATELEEELNSCDESFGFKYTGGFYSGYGTLSSACWFSPDGVACGAGYSQDSSFDNCSYVGSSGYSDMSCDDVKDALEDACSSYGSGYTCSITYTKPSYIDCD